MIKSERQQTLEIRLRSAEIASDLLKSEKVTGSGLAAVLELAEKIELWVLGGPRIEHQSTLTAGERAYVEETIPNLKPGQWSAAAGGAIEHKEGSIQAAIDHLIDAQSFMSPLLEGVARSVEGRNRDRHGWLGAHPFVAGRVRTPSGVWRERYSE